MASIADSDAYLDSGRVLGQHQAAIQLLISLLADPDIEKVSWFDLACGKGQILSQFNTNLTAEARQKISYVGYDLDVEYGKITQKAATKLGFSSARVEYGELQKFTKILGGERYDFITLINTLHEIPAIMLPSILFDCVDSLTPAGMLYVYDMESLKEPELGALTWQRSDIQVIAEALFGALSLKRNRPLVSGWGHSSVRGWSFSIDKALLSKRSPSLVSVAKAPSGRWKIN